MSEAVWLLLRSDSIFAKAWPVIMGVWVGWFTGETVGINMFWPTAWDCGDTDLAFLFAAPN